MAKSKASSRRKQPEPARQFPASLTTPRGRRHYALIIILLGLGVSHVYHSDFFQSGVSTVREVVPNTSTYWSN